MCPGSTVGQPSLLDATMCKLRHLDARWRLAGGPGTTTAAAAGAASSPSRFFDFLAALASFFAAFASFFAAFLAAFWDLIDSACAVAEAEVDVVSDITVVCCFAARVQVEPRTYLEARNLRSEREL